MISVIISLRNRTDLFGRTIDSFIAQGFPRDQWELLVCDDSSTDNPKEFLKQYSDRMNIRYIRMNRDRSGISCLANSPALSINLLLKRAKNDVVLKTDPENIQLSKSLSLSLALFSKDKIVFGKVMIGSEEGQKKITSGAYSWREKDFPLCYPGLVEETSVSSINCGPYYYEAVFSRDKALAINGVDEEYLRGIAGEDDDFAWRLRRSGVQWVWNDQFAIFHQWHPKWTHLTKEQFDEGLNKNRSRFYAEAAKGADGYRLKANEDYDWGSEAVVEEDLWI